MPHVPHTWLEEVHLLGAVLWVMRGTHSGWGLPLPALFSVECTWGHPDGGYPVPTVLFVCGKMGMVFRLGRRGCQATKQ